MATSHLPPALNTPLPLFFRSEYPELQLLIRQSVLWETSCLEESTSH